MRRSTLSAVVALLALASGHVGAKERYMVMRQTVTMSTAPDDDMRPRITGAVVAVEQGVTIIEGGARVPATGANVGDIALFACDSIDKDSPPVSTGCELLKAEPGKAPPKKAGAVNLWD